MKILLLGGDLRMRCAAAALSERFPTTIYSPENHEKFPVVVLPMPLTRDHRNILGGIPFSVIPQVAADNALILSGGNSPALSDLCGEYSLRNINYASNEALMRKNAALTAEAACALLIGASPAALIGSRALIVGHGRVGSRLHTLLLAFGCECSVVAADRCDVLPEVGLARFRFIINTVPAELFTDRHFTEMSPDTVFMELATLPPRVLPDGCRVNYLHEPGLPGRFSPQTAGRYIAECISDLLNEYLKGVTHEV